MPGPAYWAQAICSASPEAEGFPRFRRGDAGVRGQRVEMIVSHGEAH